MRSHYRTRVLLTVVLAAVASTAQQTAAHGSPIPGASHAAQGRPNYGKLPLAFEANQGQTNSQVRFLARAADYSVFLTSRGMTLALRPSNVVSDKNTSIPGRLRLGPHTAAEARDLLRGTSNTSHVAVRALTISLVGGAANPKFIGEQQLATKVNYFIGRDPKQWQTNVPTFARVRYQNVYPGIDLVYYGNNRQVEYDFDVAPGADASQVQFAVKGADAINVDAEGDLVLTVGTSHLRFQTPTIYQNIHGTRVPVAGGYSVQDATHVGFVVAAHDQTKSLVIDPVLVYSTLLGGRDDDFTDGLAVDSAGNAYVIGWTDSPDFPLASIGSYDPTKGRMFLAKLDPTGSTLMFADYFGGTTGNDEAYSIALDSSAHAYITGFTESSDFPVFPVATAYQTTLKGSQDAFLTKFSADGSSLVYSTYFGGTSSQISNAISVDSFGEATIGGVTSSTDLPVANAYQSTISADQFGDWGEYGFFTKFAADGLSLLYSSYLAGNTLNASSCSGCWPDSEVMSLVADASGNVYITGNTNTTNFPVTPGAYMTTSPANDLSGVGFVAKFNNTGGIAYSTYFGGATSSYLSAVAVDAAGSAYVTGYDIAGDGFPVTSIGICDPSTATCNGAVIAKFDPTGSTLSYSTYLGNNDVEGEAIQVDASGDAFILGSGSQFALTNPIEGYAGGGDVVVAEIDPSASTQLFATFLGGQQSEAAAQSLALDSTGDIYVTGVTQSPDFPVTQSAFQTLWGGQTDVFIAKIGVADASAVTLGPSSLQFSAQIVGNTSAPQSSVLRNMGSKTLTINSKTLTSDFAETDDCGPTVAPASFCTFTITFTPTLLGPRNGTLTVSDDASGSPHTLTLSGTGMGGGVIISPSNLTFGTSAVGTTSAVQAVTFTNTGTAALTISGIHATGDFAVASNTCGSVLANGGTCAVQVKFAPTSAGSRSGTITFTDSAASSPQVISLNGSGVDFGTSAIDTTATVKAGGTASYQLNVSPVGGNFSSPISLSCSAVPAFATCAVNPAAVVPGRKGSTAIVTVRMAGTAAQMRLPVRTQGALLAWLSMAQGIGVFGAFLLVRDDRRRKLRQVALFGILLIVMLFLVGCAGGTGAQRSPSVSNSAQPGTYSFVVIGTSGNVQHSATLTLIVQ